MRAAVYTRVVEVARGAADTDLRALGQIVIDVLLTEGVDLRRGCSLEEVKDLLLVALRAAQSAATCVRD